MGGSKAGVPKINWFATPDRIRISCLTTALYERGYNTEKKLVPMLYKVRPDWRKFLPDNITDNAAWQRADKSIRNKSEHPAVNVKKKPFWPEAQNVVDDFLKPIKELEPATTKSAKRASDKDVRLIKLARVQPILYEVNQIVLDSSWDFVDPRGLMKHPDPRAFLEKLQSEVSVSWSELAQRPDKNGKLGRWTGMLDTILSSWLAWAQHEDSE